ncbi:hypothetical protein B4U79_07659, partial [Dinothrombium tinctorium]
LTRSRVSRNSKVDTKVNKVVKPKLRVNIPHTIVNRELAKSENHKIINRKERRAEIGNKHRNGFIEGRELDNFLKEFVSSVNSTDINPEFISDSILPELKECFMEAYDDNKDGKIEIRELAQLLPLEESFLLLFRFDNPLDSSVEFMKIWREYDSDGSGFIEADELK